MFENTSSSSDSNTSSSYNNDDCEEMILLIPNYETAQGDDQIVPVMDSAKKSARIIKGANEIYYPGAPHGLTATRQDHVNGDLLSFLRS